MCKLWMCGIIILHVISDEVPATLDAVRRQSQQDMDTAEDGESVTQTAKATVSSER